jgi:hypothetical protein
MAIVLQVNPGAALLVGGRLTQLNIDLPRQASNEIAMAHSPPFAMHETCQFALWGCR